MKELSVCNGNSKKALIDKLLAVMNMWNMRATLFDLMLMIKEVWFHFSVSIGSFHYQLLISSKKSNDIKITSNCALPYTRNHLHRFICVCVFS